MVFYAESHFLCNNSLHRREDRGQLCNPIQGRNHKENLGSTSAMVGKIALPPPGWDRVRVSENLGATSVALVDPVDTSLINIHITKRCFEIVEIQKCFGSILRTIIGDVPYVLSVLSFL